MFFMGFLWIYFVCIVLWSFVVVIVLYLLLVNIKNKWVNFCIVIWKINLLIYWKNFKILYVIFWVYMLIFGGILFWWVICCYYWWRLSLCGKDLKMVVVRVLVYGGKGVFGVICVFYFKFRDWVSLIL